MNDTFGKRPGWGTVLWLMLVGIAPWCCSGQTNSPAAYVDYSMSHEGDAAKGKALFLNEQKLACTKCHTIDGSGSRTGPDLASIGEKFSRRELIRSVLEPSATIAVGYETTVVETKGGESYQGVIKQTGDNWIALMGADGKLTRFESKDIQQQHDSPVSIMPEGLQMGLSLAEFGDLIEYLTTLKNTDGVAAGTTTSVPQAAKPAEFPTFFSPDVIFKAPLWFGEMPGQDKEYLVMEHGGKIWLIKKGETKDDKILLVDLSPNIQWGPACGTLGLAFHPKFIENHKYYLQYQVEYNGHLVNHIAQRVIASDGWHDTGEMTTIMEIPGSTQDHNGGCIEFGPDGFLYIAMGDTGPQRDPEGHAQNLGSLKGKMLRIDVDHPNGTNLYSIPGDNPLVNQAGARPEIWAWGLREPWRFTFDRVTGDLWLGDVGQDKFEEVDIIRKGENFGWNVYEGFNHFSDKYHHPGAKYVMPIYSYAHSGVGVSITGGYVYRGAKTPKMDGQYICADFQLQKVWAITQKDRIMQTLVEIGHAPSRVSSLGQDAAGELYLVGYDSGLIYHIDLNTVDLATK